MYTYDVRSGIKKIRTKTVLAVSGATLGFAGLVLAVALPLGAKAAGTQVVVTPTNTQGWASTDVRGGGTVSYAVDPPSPGNPKAGALQLTTTLSAVDKVDYMHAANTLLSSITELSYYTKQNSAPFPGADASYQLPVFLDGTSAGFTTFVYEPYENGTVVPGDWQQWPVSTGQFWSSRDYTDPSNPSCTVTAGHGGAPFYTLAALKTACPNAVAVGFGVNIGSNNPSYNVETDLVNFNGTTYNFEPYAVASDKDSCKKDGWMNTTDQNGNGFRNQGQCVSWTNGRGR